MKTLISNKPLVITLSVFIITIGYFVYVSSEAYNQYDIPSGFIQPERSDYTVLQAIENCDSSNILNNFNYNQYLKNGNYCDFKSLEKDFNLIDSIYRDPLSITETLFYTALADSMIAMDNKELLAYNPEYLLYKIGWVKRFVFYAECAPKRKYLYVGIYDKWIQEITDRLEHYISLDNNIKYEAKFKAIVTICQQEGYTIPLGMSSTDKIADYLVEGRYAYIWNRFWYSTGFFTKLIAFIIVIFISFSCTFTLFKILKK